MITNVLLDHAALVPVLLVLTVVLCGAAGFVILRADRIGRPLAQVLLGLSLLAVLGLTLVPDSGGIDEIRCTAQFYVPSLKSVEIVANFALFIPAGFFLALLTRRPLIALVAVSGLSAVIETVQALVPAIARACDTNDWVWNTLGAAIGVLLAYGVRRISPVRTQ